MKHTNNLLVAFIALEVMVSIAMAQVPQKMSYWRVIIKMKVNIMADSAAIRLSINENIKQQLGLRIRQQLIISLANGTKRTLDVAGPIRLKFMDKD